MADTKEMIDNYLASSLSCICNNDCEIPELSKDCQIWFDNNKERLTTLIADSNSIALEAVIADWEDYLERMPSYKKEQLTSQELTGLLWGLSARNKSKQGEY